MIARSSAGCKPAEAEAFFNWEDLGPAGVCGIAVPEPMQRHGLLDGRSLALPNRCVLYSDLYLPTETEQMFHFNETFIIFALLNNLTNGQTF